MTAEQSNWSEEDSSLYRELAAVAVPAREQQLASLIALMPFASEEAFSVVELGCGEGILSAAILEAFPNARVVALDGSESMRQEASGRLRRFGARASVVPFDLASSEWHGVMKGADCVVSSLALHHLPGEGKRRLFETAFRGMSERGAILIADLVDPQRREARQFHADVYDLVAQERSRSKSGSDELYQKLVDEEWNYYRFPDAEEQPSPLFDQLLWLTGAGFAAVDCFWLLAGHAIYGGYKEGAGSSGGAVPFERALLAVQAEFGDGN